MILLAAYAFFVWYLAMRFRRQWAGYASVAAGVLILLLLVRPALGENLLGQVLPSGVRGGFRQLAALIIPEAVLIALVGFFVASLPRSVGANQCRCGYELVGLDPVGLRCPECGREWTGPGSGRDRSVELTPVPSRSGGGVGTAAGSGGAEPRLPT